MNEKKGCDVKTSVDLPETRLHSIICTEFPMVLGTQIVIVIYCDDNKNRPNNITVIDIGKK